MIYVYQVCGDGALRLVAKFDGETPDLMKLAETYGLGSFLFGPSPLPENYKSVTIDAPRKEN